MSLYVFFFYMDDELNLTRHIKLPQAAYGEHSISYHQYQSLETRLTCSVVCIEYCAVVHTQK